MNLFRENVLVMKVNIAVYVGVGVGACAVRKADE